MKVESKFLTGILSRLAKKLLRDKLGGEAEVRINNIQASAADELVHVHLDFDVDLTKDELNRLLKAAGI